LTSELATAEAVVHSAGCYKYIKGVEKDHYILYQREQQLFNKFYLFANKLTALTASSTLKYGNIHTIYPPKGILAKKD